MDGKKDWKDRWTDRLANRKAVLNAVLVSLAGVLFLTGIYLVHLNGKTEKYASGWSGKFSRALQERCSAFMWWPTATGRKTRK